MLKAAKPTEAAMRAALVINVRRVSSWLKAEGVAVPENFEEKCFQNTCTESGHLRKSTEHLDHTTVLLLIELVTFWKPILPSKVEQDEVIVNGIYSLYKKKVFTVNNNRECQKLFVGGKCSAIREEEPLANGSCGCVVTTSIALGGKAVKIRQ